MSIDATNLMQQVYDYFNKLYTASSPKAFLIFQKLGIPINPADVPTPADAMEFTSTMASYPLVIQQSSATQDSTRSVYKEMANLLDSSMPMDDASMAALGAAKQQGATDLGITLGSMSGIADYEIHPVLATPANWYDMSQSSNWSSYSVGQAPAKNPPIPVAATAAPPVSPTPPARLLIPGAAWRTVSPALHPILFKPSVGPSIPIRAPGLKPIMMQSMHPSPPMRMMTARAVTGASPATSTAAQSATAVLVRPETEEHSLGSSTLSTSSGNIVRRSLGASQLQILLNNVGLVHANSTEQNVSSSNLSVNFDFCIVGLGWPWLPNGFLMQRNWFLQGYARGEYSIGTGAADPGLLPVLPTGFIAIRNLRISAQWSQQDISAIQTTVGLNAFSLMGSSFNSQTGILTCSGIQIVGWFCSALPVLPPVADPHMVQP